ncbi:MAG: hypothetical protein R2860_16905 [Desulfobacterales bacterium]
MINGRVVMDHRRVMTLDVAAVSGGRPADRVGNAGHEMIAMPWENTWCKAYFLKMWVDGVGLGYRRDNISLTIWENLNKKNICPKI